MSRRPLQLEGQRFNRLTVLDQAGMANRQTLWKCLCICGKEHLATGGSLRSGNTQSCGCLQRDRTSLGNTKHGQSGNGGRKQPSLTYNSWRAMIQRCTDPKFTRFPKYGALGVTVCDRWQGEHGFENFLADVGERPEGTTLGRFGDVGNYEPRNVKWMDSAEQVANWRPDHARKKIAA